MQDLFTLREYPGWQLLHVNPAPKTAVEVQAFGIQTDLRPKPATITCQRIASSKHVKHPVV
jgi:hypothetical protein